MEISSYEERANSKNCSWEEPHHEIMQQKKAQHENSASWEKRKSKRSAAGK